MLMIILALLGMFAKQNKNSQRTPRLKKKKKKKKKKQQLTGQWEARDTNVSTVVSILGER